MWKAVLGLKKPDEILRELRQIREQRMELAEFIRRVSEFTQKPTPFNLTVHTYSNLRLEATLVQDGFAPGDEVHLTASLWEYQSPLRTDASVWADVVEPDGNRSVLNFTRTAAGSYAATWTTTLPGVYRFGIRAEGKTSGNARFMRAKELTAGVWAGGDRPFDPVGGGNGTVDGKDDGKCKTILCFLDFVMKSSVLREWFKRFDFDIEGFRKCVERHCRKEAPATEGRAQVATTPTTLTHLPEFGQLVNTFASFRAAEPRLIEAGETTPVKRKPRMEGNDENMFLKPEQIKDKPPERPKRKEREKPDK
jgi:hypothetical protein